MPTGIAEGCWAIRRPESRDSSLIEVPGDLPAGRSHRNHQTSPHTILPRFHACRTAQNRWDGRSRLLWFVARAGLFGSRYKRHNRHSLRHGYPSHCRSGTVSTCPRGTHIPTPLPSANDRLDPPNVLPVISKVDGKTPPHPPNSPFPQENDSCPAPGSFLHFRQSNGEVKQRVNAGVPKADACCRLSRTPLGTKGSTVAGSGPPEMPTSSAWPGP